MRQDRNSFTLEMKNVAVVEQPKWPALDSLATPARMSFKMVRKSNGEHVKFEDPTRHFRFTGTRATCQMEVEPRSVDRVLLEVRSTGNVEV